MGLRNLSLRRKVTTTKAEAVNEKTDETLSVTMMACICAVVSDMLNFCVVSSVGEC